MKDNIVNNNPEILKNDELIKKIILAITDSVNLEEVYYKIRQFER